MELIAEVGMGRFQVGLMKIAANSEDGITISQHLVINPVLHDADSAAGTGMVLYVPPGTYRISSNLTISSTLRASWQRRWNL